MCAIVNGRPQPLPGRLAFRIPGAPVRHALPVAIAALWLVTADARADDFAYTLTWHFTPPSYSGCGDFIVSDGAISCEILDPDFNDLGGQPNFCWAMVGQVPKGTGPGAPGGVGGVQFGIDYDPTVLLSGWTLCTGGSEIPQDDPEGTWPAPGTGNAVTWSGGCYLVTENDDGLTRIGYLTIDAASSGYLFFGVDPRIGDAMGAGCDAATRAICGDMMGIADTTIDGEGENTCRAKCGVPVASTSWGRIKALY